MGTEWLCYQLFTLVIVRLRTVAPCPCPASRESTVPNIASSGKDKNSKLEVCFLLNT